MPTLQRLGLSLIATFHIACSPLVHRYIFANDQRVFLYLRNLMATVHGLMPLGIASPPVSPRTQYPPKFTGPYNPSAYGWKKAPDKKNVQLFNDVLGQTDAAHSRPVTLSTAAEDAEDNAPETEVRQPQVIARPSAAIEPTNLLEGPPKLQHHRGNHSPCGSTKPSTTGPGLPGPLQPPRQHTRACQAMVAHLSWAEVKHYTNNLALHDKSSNFDSLLAELDARYIAVAIVRERGLVDLLERELAEQRVAGRTDSAAQSDTVQPQTRGTRPVPGKRPASVSLISERVKNFESDGGSYFPDVLAHGFDTRTSVCDTAEAPLTPRSEAAAGQMFQNAAGRHAVRKSPIRANTESRPSTAVRFAAYVRRLQFEAAWKWIDGHVEEYVDKFAERELVKSKSKRTLWDELVGLREKTEELTAAISAPVAS